MFPFPNRQDGTFRYYSWEKKKKAASRSAGSGGDGREGCSQRAGRLGDRSPVLEPSPPVKINLLYSRRVAGPIAPGGRETRGTGAAGQAVRG